MRGRLGGTDTPPSARAPCLTDRRRRLTPPRPAAPAPAVPPQIARRVEGRTPTQTWDACVDVGCEVYSGRMHALLWDNCHSHVARCLNEMRYGGRADWNMVTLAVWMFGAGAYVNAGRAAAMWLPFALIVGALLALRYGLF